MKSITKLWGLFFVVASLANQGQAQGWEPFDQCALRPDSSPKILYRQLRHHMVQTLIGPDYYGKTEINQIFGYVNGECKLIDYFLRTEDLTNAPYEYHSTDSRPYSPNFDLLYALSYGCGVYGNGIFPSGDNILNDYLNGDDVSEYFGPSPFSSLEVEEDCSGGRSYLANFDLSYAFPVDGLTSIVVEEGAELDGAFVQSKKVNDGKDAGKNCDCSKGSRGMPVWFVTEPYINLWIKDTPVFYRTSLGEELGFELMYKQRDTRPSDPTVTAVPNTGWHHNWFSYLSFQIPKVLTGTNSLGYALAGLSPRGAVMRANWETTNDFSKWSGILYSSDGGEHYFAHDATNEVDSALQIQPLMAAGTNTGFRVIHPDGSQDIYGRLSAARPAYGQVKSRGQHKTIASATARDVDQDANYEKSWSTNDFTEFDNSTIHPTPGTTIGYMVGEALLTSRVDRYGNAIHLTYDASNRLDTITDYDSKLTQLYYTNGLLVRVEMPYGKTALLGYTNGLLSSIQDAEGMTSYLGYSPAWRMTGLSHSTPAYYTNYVVTSLITPYGTTTFDHTEATDYMSVSNPPTLRMITGTLSGGSAEFETNYTGSTSVYVGQVGGTNRVNRACKVTLPDGSHELYVYRYDSAGLVPDGYPSSEIPYNATSTVDDGLWQDLSGSTPIDARLTTRNSFYWNRQQSALIASINLTNLSSSDLALARMSHWLAASGDDDELSDAVSLVRAPSPDGTKEGAKTWFDYASKPQRWKASPENSGNVTARVMPDGNVAYQRTLISDGLIIEVTENYTAANGENSIRTYGYGYEVATNSSVYGDYSYKRLVSATWPDGSLTRQFSADGLRLDQIDSLANTNTVYFNSRYQVAGIQLANGLTTTNRYGADGFLVERIQIQATATNTYTFANGLPSLVTSPLGGIFYLQWDKLDRLLKVSYPDGTSSSNIYQKLDRVAHQDRLGKWSYADYDSMGQLESSIDANTNITQYSWCLCGALESILDPLSHLTSYIRDNNGNVIYQTSDDSFITTYNRDIFGRVTNVTSSAGLDLDYTYNLQGLITNVSNPAGMVMAATYDANDLPLAATDSRGITTLHTYDGLGRLLTRQDDLMHTETFTYAAPGLVQYQDPLNHISTYGYDPAGRLTSVTNANLEVVRMGYNPIGELVSLTDGRNNTKRWAYDIYGRQIAETNAAGILVKTNGYNANGQLTSQWTAAKGLTQFGYDANGNLTSIVQPSSGTIAYTYDALDRLLTFSSGIGTSAFSYTNWGAFKGAPASEDGPWASDTINYGYVNHKLASIGLGSWTETIGYDAALRPETFTSSAGTFTNAFNGAGRQVGSLTMPHNLVTNDYDAIGALKLTEFKKAGTVLDTHGYNYDPVGLITNITRLNGVKADYGYDPIGQLISAQAFEAGGAPRLNEQFGYGYDAAHNLADRTNNTLVQAFTSNAKDELANVVRVGTLTVSGSVTGAVVNLGVGGTRAEIYSDGTFATTNGLTLNNGNNLFVTAGSNSAGALVVSTKTAVNLPVNVYCSYDANGNLVSDGLKGFEYDDANQLVRVTVTNGWKSEFSYDGLGRRRITKDYSWSGASWTLTNEVRYVWDGMAVLQERDGANAVKVTYTRGLDLSGTMQGAGGIGGLLARTDASSTNFYHSDGGGNITALTDSSGNVVARYLYDPFGNLLAKSGAMADVNRYRFSSKEVHPNSGLYYYGYRFYEPNLQRWVNQDPIQVRGGVNFYSFIKNSPINAYDSFGMVEARFNPIAMTADLWNGIQDIVSEGIYYSCYAPPPEPLPPAARPFQVTLDPPVIDLTIIGAGMIAPQFITATRGQAGMNSTAKSGVSTSSANSAEASAATANAGVVEKSTSSSGSTQSNVSKTPTFPKPPRPSGPTGPEMSKLLGFGSGSDVPGLQKTCSKEFLQKNGITKEIANQWKEVYRWQVENMPLNPAAPGRLELMNRILKTLAE